MKTEMAPQRNELTKAQTNHSFVHSCHYLWIEWELALANQERFPSEEWLGLMGPSFFLIILQQLQ
jgi:hypothetical protein